MEELRVKKIFITADFHGDEASLKGCENTDVIVLLSDGHKYTASFFTYAFVEKLRKKNRLTGDNLYGKYFWGKNMVLVENCSLDVIKPVVKNIIEEGEFIDVFRQL